MTEELRNRLRVPEGSWEYTLPVDSEIVAHPVRRVFVSFLWWMGRRVTALQPDGYVEWSRRGGGAWAEESIFAWRYLNGRGSG